MEEVDEVAERSMAVEKEWRREFELRGKGERSTATRTGNIYAMEVDGLKLSGNARRSQPLDLPVPSGHRSCLIGLGLAG